jgi:hypothetical protein
MKLFEYQLRDDAPAENNELSRQRKQVAFLKYHTQDLTIVIIGLLDQALKLPFKMALD